MLDIQSVGFDSPAYREAVQLRDRVLRRPLGLQLTAEDRERDRPDRHIVGILNSKVVACLILSAYAPSIWRMRQVAVDPTFQRQGIGEKLVVFAEHEALAANVREIILHARDTAVPFYEKLGYQPDGEPFTEVGIRHLTMKKTLTPS